jgi:hypothetical protein
MMLFVGMGRTLVVRPHALVAARYAATYQRLTGGIPDGNRIERGVSIQRELWMVNGNNDGLASDEIARMNSNGGEAGGWFQQLVLNFAFDATIHPVVSHQPVEGVVPKLLKIGTVTGTYYVAGGTWENNDCGAFISYLGRKLPWPLSKCCGG